MATSTTEPARANVHVLRARDLQEPERACPVQEANRRALLLARLRAALGQHSTKIPEEVGAERLSRDFGLGFWSGAIIVGLMWGVVAWLG